MAAEVVKRAMSMRVEAEPTNEEATTQVVVGTMVERRKKKQSVRSNEAESSYAEDTGREAVVLKVLKEELKRDVVERLRHIYKKLDQMESRLASSMEMGQLQAKLDSCLEVVLEMRAGVPLTKYAGRRGPPKSKRANFLNSSSPTAVENQLLNLEGMPMPEFIAQSSVQSSDSARQMSPDMMGGPSRGFSAMSADDDMLAIKASFTKALEMNAAGSETLEASFAPSEESTNIHVEVVEDAHATSPVAAVATDKAVSSEVEAHDSDDEANANAVSRAKRLSYREAKMSSRFASGQALSPDSYKPRRSSKESSQNGFGAFITNALVKVRTRTPAQKWTWLFLEDPDMVVGGRFFAKLISVFIVVAAAIPMLMTLEPSPIDVDTATYTSICLDVAFLVEVVIRFWVCPNRLAFFVNYFNLIDMTAGFLPLILRISSQAVSVTQLNDHDDQVQFIAACLCLVPILQVLKLLRRFETFHLIAKALVKVTEALPVLLYVLTILVLVFASVIYLCEPRSNIGSMPEALWLTIVTVGTIGYGDVVPKSTAGVLATSALIVVSALYMAIPIGVVGKAFAEVWDDRDRLMLVHRARTRFLSGGYRAVDIPAMFCSFDTDGDGGITMKEFIKMMRDMEVEISSHRVIDLFNAFDIDRDGTIDDQEFVRTLFPNSYAAIYGMYEETDAEPPDLAFDRGMS
eukprot:TRINITY_DN15227_c0_g2_i1.p1 TRINITY_DN15227_c0_g2~~TRINITY_DN15227_c0_g2_i1.p1  ORF type:complete len:688 (-),score=118.89 TRINITY_DN15227_c0_g2_i1:46-2109(-)